jgi:ribosomal protein S18 acetylase RimI-like enzyme
MPIELSPTAPEEPDAIALHEALYREGDERGGLPPALSVPPMPRGLAPPSGMLLIARVEGERAGLGGVRDLQPGIAEVKSMYVAPPHRGRGIGRMLLAELERIARERGCREVRLDSSRYLTEAVALYRSAGYEEMADYNGNRMADIWFRRRL